MCKREYVEWKGNYWVMVQFGTKVTRIYTEWGIRVNKYVASQRKTHSFSFDPVSLSLMWFCFKIVYNTRAVAPAMQRAVGLRFLLLSWKTSADTWFHVMWTPCGRDDTMKFTTTPMYILLNTTTTFCWVGNDTPVRFKLSVLSSVYVAFYSTYHSLLLYMWIFHLYIYIYYFLFFMYFMYTSITLVDPTFPVGFTLQ